MRTTGFDCKHVVLSLGPILAMILGVVIEQHELDAIGSVKVALRRLTEQRPKFEN